MRRHFAVATWPKPLKVVSTLGTLVTLGVGYAAYHVIPAPNGFTHQFGLGIALLPIAILVASLFFIVRGYAIEGTDLYVERLVSSTRISLVGLSSVSFEPAACKDSIRVFGNGGLFSFSGLFYSKRLGRFRLFATDLAHAVVLVLPQRTVVVTPEDTLPFIEHLRQKFPHAGTAGVIPRP
jgi:hypothetical protein